MYLYNLCVCWIYVHDEGGGVVASSSPFDPASNMQILFPLRRNWSRDEDW